MSSTKTFPELMTPAEVAEAIRKSRKAVYAMNERGLLPPPVRIGRRILFYRSDLIRWLQKKRAASSERS